MYFIIVLLITILTIDCVPPAYWDQFLHPSMDNGEVSAPLMPPYGDRFNLTCDFPTGDWSEAALQIRFCYHPSCRSFLMVTPKDINGEFKNKSDNHLPELQWKLETVGPVQRLTVSFLVVSSVSGIYRCTILTGINIEVLKTVIIIADVELRRRPDTYCDIRFSHLSQLQYLWTPNPDKVRLLNCGEVRERNSLWQKHVHYAVGMSGLEPSCTVNRDMVLCHRYVAESLRDNNCTRAAEEKRTMILRGKPLEEDWFWMCMAGMFTICIVGTLTLCLRLRYKRHLDWSHDLESEETRRRRLKKRN
ncbi:Rh33 [macacine betaherpesvirus 3]|nr:Rh33 [macacine betaherpesvirus 3]